MQAMWLLQTPVQAPRTTECTWALTILTQNASKQSDICTSYSGLPNSDNSVSPPVLHKFINHTMFSLILTDVQP